MYGIESYIAVPLNRRDGSYFGTLCALDPLPASHLSEDNFAMFELLASLISYELEEQDNENLRRALAESLAGQLQEAQLQAEEREKMMAILGHDLRNPLTAIKLSAEAIVMTAAPQDVNPLAMQIVSSASRMGRMITDLLDFTRARFTGTMALNRASVNMRVVCEKVVQELQIANPRRRIRLISSIDGAGEWDGDRVAQVVSNLVSNALDYGSEEATVDVILDGDVEMMKLSVENKAPDLSVETMKTMFEAFHGGAAMDGRSRGVGLGLFIVQQILLAHGGQVTVSSQEGSVRFDTLWPRKAEGPSN